MKLPNGELAEISMEKLIGYCLNPEHSRGKNQARVFRSRLTEFGQQFKVDWTIPKREGTQLRTIWEISLINPNPRLISAFIK